MTEHIEFQEGLPLAGLRVVEFTHMVMGPSCGMILGDLGADVIKVEPLKGDNTRRLPGLGVGFFRSFNRNKRSVALDLKNPEALRAAQKLAASADIVSENFKPGKLDELGLGYDDLRALNPRLIYVSHKGFLPGPYQNRTALDEIVQMMGGLAYMTGPPGQPMRAGTSVNDIMGGMWGVIGILAALIERQATGHGQLIQSSLFENCVFLSGQHMQQFAMTGEPPSPMPVRKTTWPVYDLFSTSDGQPIFIGAVSDSQWKSICVLLDLTDFLGDPALQTNNDRVSARPRIIPLLKKAVAKWQFNDLCTALEKEGLPFAPVNGPQHLFDDLHLLASGGLGRVRNDAGGESLVPLLPLILGKRRLGAKASSIPSIGDGTEAILAELGYSAKEIQRLIGAKTAVA